MADEVEDKYKHPVKGIWLQVLKEIHTETERVLFNIHQEDMKTPFEDPNAAFSTNRFNCYGSGTVGPTRANFVCRSYCHIKWGDNYLDNPMATKRLSAINAALVLYEALTSLEEFEKNEIRKIEAASAAQKPQIDKPFNPFEDTIR